MRRRQGECGGPTTIASNDSDWVDTLVGIARNLGLNEVKIRWKLTSLKNAWEKRRRQIENRTLHLKYEHAVCPRCGRVQDGASRKCALCGAAIGSRAWQFTQRLGVSVPKVLSVSSLLAIGMLAAYLRLMLARPGSGYLSVDSRVLVEFGAYDLMAIQAGQLWRHATAIFLHIDLWHLGFNLVALAQVGPGIEEVFGRGRMIFIFMLSGIVPNIACQLYGLEGVSAGASGSITGLVGAAAGWGQRDGTSQGLAIRNRMLQWGMYTIAFGLVVHANHIAHAVGFFLDGIACFVTPPRWWRRHQAGLST